MEVRIVTRDGIDLAVGVAELALLMRTECGISQSELARRTGIAQPYLSAIERGARTPTLQTLQRIARNTDHQLVFAAEPQRSPDMIP
ncbi:MAG: helix-turn-helix transcriptional regulator [Propionibacteriaceae bacterium]|nr:helix-turn-helix transcriptional regulator [Propionibacteriaceae bacterium]